MPPPPSYLFYKDKHKIGIQSGGRNIFVRFSSHVYFASNVHFDYLGFKAVYTICLAYNVEMFKQ